MTRNTRTLIVYKIVAKTATIALISLNTLTAGAYAAPNGIAMSGILSVRFKGEDPHPAIKSYIRSAANGENFHGIHHINEPLIKTIAGDAVWQSGDTDTVKRMVIRYQPVVKANVVVGFQEFSSDEVSALGQFTPGPSDNIISFRTVTMGQTDTVVDTWIQLRSAAFHSQSYVTGKDGDDKLLMYFGGPRPMPVILAEHNPFAVVEDDIVAKRHNAAAYTILAAYRDLVRYGDKVTATITTDMLRRQKMVTRDYLPGEISAAIDLLITNQHLVDSGNGHLRQESRRLVAGTMQSPTRHLIAVPA